MVELVFISEWVIMAQELFGMLPECQKETLQVVEGEKMKKIDKAGSISDNICI